MCREGLLEKDLAVIMGITVQTVSRYFTKEKIPDICCKALKEKFPEYNYDWLCCRNAPMIDDPSRLFREKMKEHLG